MCNNFFLKKIGMFFMLLMPLSTYAENELKLELVYGDSLILCDTMGNKRIQDFMSNEKILPEKKLQGHFDQGVKYRDRSDGDNVKGYRYKANNVTLYSFPVLEAKSYNAMDDRNKSISIGYTLEIKASKREYIRKLKSISIKSDNVTIDGDFFKDYESRIQDKGNGIIELVCDIIG